MKSRDVLALCFIGIVIFVIWLIVQGYSNRVTSGRENIPTLEKNGLYDHATTDFVAELIQDKWTKLHQKSDDIIYYVDPSDAKNTLSINCYASLNALQDSNNKDVDGLQTNGYQLADISYSGIDSRTYLLVQYTSTTAFTATLRNCSILMFVQAWSYDGKTELDAEVKYLQQINEVNR